MKKLIIVAAIAVFGFSNVNAQDNNDSGVNKVIEQAKDGGFYIGANLGFSFISNTNLSPGTSGDENFGSFNFGFDAAYLFGVIPNLEVGLLTGYTQFIANGQYVAYNDNSNGGTGVLVDFKDASFVPIAASARYYFADRKFFGGLDLGVGINVSGDAKTGFYARPKFGFNLNKITLIASFQSISGDQDYNNSNGTKLYSLNGFKSINVGIEYGF
tara:strand:+ start:27503 stop:28144 length:642 start_codon:yes stop_codon:yes gene_type:complete